MKQIVTLCITFLLFNIQVYSCDRSYLVLNSVTDLGGSYLVDMQLNIGGGITGVVTGADAATRTFAFNVFGPVGMTMTGFAPAALTSDTTMATYAGIINPGGFLGSQTALIYQDSGTDFACITSTVLCGEIHSSSYNVTITLDMLPDSIRVLAIEGAGNPVGGCYPNPDMVLDIPVILLVDWLAVSAAEHMDGVEIKWEVENEILGTTYEIEHSLNGIDFTRRMSINALDNLEIRNQYRWIDESPNVFDNYYRIKSIEPDDTESYSETVNYTSRQKNDIIITHDLFNQSVLIQQEINQESHIVVYNANGQVLYSQTRMTQQEQRIALNSLPKGLLYIVVGNSNEHRSQALLNL